MEERLQKIISAAGIASRRKAEVLIREGRVTLNGQVVLELGTKADPETDEICVDGKSIHISSRRIYILLNKPVGYASTCQDPHAEKTVLDLVPEIKEAVYPVGRLDLDSHGLLILTNDGDFTCKVTHPSSGIPKTYKARVKGIPSEEAIKRLQQGIQLDEGMTAPAEVKILQREQNHSQIQMTIHEGKNRQVRRMLGIVGHPAIDLARIQIGPIKLGNLKLGQWRYLRPDEVKSLLAPSYPGARQPGKGR